MNTHVTCSRCHRDSTLGIEDWNAELKQGVIVAILCPQCQTPEENAEATINEATLVYGSVS